MPTRLPLTERLRRRAVRMATENIGLKLLSLCFAVSIWAWVQSERVVELRARVVVQYKDPVELVPVEELRKSLVVTLSGPQGLVRTVQRSVLTVPVDLSEAQEGPVSIDFTERTIMGLPPGLEVLQVSPPAMDIQLDRRMTRTVRVKPAVIGEPTEGWQRAGTTVEPDQLEISGPSSLVRNIAEVSTDIVDVSGARDTRAVDVTLAIKERMVLPVDATPVKVTVTIEPILSTRTFTEVPVLSRLPGWLATPDTVRVTLGGPVRVLSEVKPEKIHLLVRAPSESPAPERFTVTWDAEADDNTVEVVHQGPTDLIEVVRVEPPRITLESTK